ncbi:MAG: substrate-binding periplasmic protein [Thermodesulfobacteriota bacterium]
MSKKFRAVIFSLVFFLVVAAAIGTGVYFLKYKSGQPSQVAEKKTLLDQIIANGQIRCAYIPWPPMAIKDPNTGRVSGVFPEVLEKIASNAGLKVVWSEQVDYGTAIEGLKTRRYDMVGTAIWSNTNRGLHASFPTPLCFSAVEAFVRVDEKRIKSLRDVNNPNVTISTIEGEAAEAIARQDFPKARRTGLPQGTDTAQLYLELITKKADVVFHDLVAANEFMAKNPNKIKKLAPGKPLRVFANCYMIPKGGEEFRDFLNIAIEEMLNTGFIDSVLKKYNMEKVTYPVALPYRQW